MHPPSSILNIAIATQDGHKQSALHRACENQFEEIAVTLINAGANANLQVHHNGNLNVTK
jgi:ankyrin repeat protein